eukprot:362483-Pleurochrysis_carterae.AAC.1
MRVGVRLGDERLQGVDRARALLARPHFEGDRRQRLLAARAGLVGELAVRPVPSCAARPLACTLAPPLVRGLGRLRPGVLPPIEGGVRRLRE